MSSDILTAPLEELCEAVFDCPHSTPAWTDQGVVVLRSSNIRNGRLDLSSPSFTDEFHYEERSKRARIKAGDLVITREAPMGEVCLIPDNLRCCLGQRMVMLRPDQNQCHGQYLLYALQSKRVQDQIQSHEGTGSTVSNLRIPVLKQLLIPSPGIDTQKAIAHILGNLDDKIELNRKTNETLEAMAKALFKSWFVDFDPVRAKAEGRPSGLPAEVSDLFPDSFEDSELGEIPSGWRVAQVEEHLETVLGGTPSRKRSDYWGGKVPWIGSGMVNEFRVTKPTELITELGLAESATKLLPIRSTLIAITGATLGQVSVNEIKVCANQSVVAILPSIDFGAEYIYLWILSNISTLVAAQTGGAQQHVNKNNVNELPLLVPSQATLDRFGAYAKSLFDKIAVNIFSSESLQDLRDTLLPKLISGEIRIPDAEKMLEEVGI